ncbi:MAG TPA: hypothetical protein VE983_09430 [Solirubrobacteraceae bacterium]|nr:hypothetical protein [Solirubrobacteraceae bacterium]
MRRIIVVATLLAAMGGAAVAFAAGNFDKFTAKETFKPNAAGSTSKPSPLGYAEHWTASGNPSGNAAPLTKIVAKAYGLQYNGSHFPTCTAAQINAGGASGKWDKVCPKGSYIGGGPVEAEVTPPAGGNGSACDPLLRIFNGGGNTQTFFFVVAPWSDQWGTVPSNRTCAGAKTGTSCAPYTGTLSHSGKTSIETIKLPGCASTDAAGLHLYAALQKLDVTYKKLTAKVGGKTIGYTQSVACSSGKRPYSFTFTAQNYQGKSPSMQTTTVSGTQACS